MAKPNRDKQFKKQNAELLNEAAKRNNQKVVTKAVPVTPKPTPAPKVTQILLSAVEDRTLTGGVKIVVAPNGKAVQVSVGDTCTAKYLARAAGGATTVQASYVTGSYEFDEKVVIDLLLSSKEAFNAIRAMAETYRTELVVCAKEAKYALTAFADGLLNPLFQKSWTEKSAKLADGRNDIICHFSTAALHYTERRVGKAALEAEIAVAQASIDLINAEFTKASEIANFEKFALEAEIDLSDVLGSDVNVEINVSAKVTASDKSLNAMVVKATTDRAPYEEKISALQAQVASYDELMAKFDAFIKQTTDVTMMEDNLRHFVKKHAPVVVEVTEPVVEEVQADEFDENVTNDSAAVDSAELADAYDYFNTHENLSEEYDMCLAAEDSDTKLANAYRVHVRKDLELAKQALEKTTTK